MATEIIFLTSSFPVSKGEPFLELEYKYLKKYGSKTYFLVKNANKDNALELNDPNITLVYRKDPSTLQALKAISKKMVIKELTYIFKQLPAKYYFSATKIALASYINAISIKKKLEEMLETKSNEVILYSYWCDDAAIAIALLKDHPKVKKTITRTHGWDLYFHIHQTPYLPFRSLIQQRIDAICPISSKGKEVIQQQWKVPTDNVKTCRLGVYNRALQNKKEAKQFTIVSCSNIIPLKRVQLLAEAILLLNEKVSWYHFGSGPEEHKVQTIIQKNTKHEMQLMGQKTNAELMNFYEQNEVHLFINVSTTEGIPVSIMEAMSAAIPVMATNVGGTSEIVNENNGILLPADISAKQLASQINSFMKLNSEEKLAFSKGALEMWNKNYNAETNFKYFAEEILQLSIKNDK